MHLMYCSFFCADKVIKERKLLLSSDKELDNIQKKRHLDFLDIQGSSVSSSFLCCVLEVSTTHQRVCTVACSLMEQGGCSGP